jgi:hypothetical protein
MKSDKQLNAGLNGIERHLNKKERRQEMVKLLRSMIVLLAITTVYGTSFAAESVSASLYTQSRTQNQIVILVTAQSDTSGAYTASRTVTAAEVGFEYQKSGYYLGHAYVKSHASSTPNTAATITITDETGAQLVGSNTGGDTLTVSTSASGFGYLVDSRGAVQRPVNSLLSLTVGDTQSGTATSIIYIYLVLVK